MTTKFRTIQSKLSTQRRRYMSQGGTIVQRKANQFIPNEYLEKVLAANPNCWGAAMSGDGELQLNSADEGASFEFIQETVKTFADKDITFYFGHSDAALNLVDIPPHILVVKKEGEEEVVQIVGFFDGNFPGYVKKDSSHPPEYHLAVDYLIPKLEGLMEISDGNLDKATEQMKKAYFKKELLLTSVSRGTITLVCANGTALTFAQNDTAGEYPWGWVSNTHGYTAGVKKEEDKPAKKTMFPSRSTVREKVTPSEAIAEAVAAPKTDATFIKNYTVRKERPGAHLSRKDKKNWYISKIGHRPRGWEQSIEIDTFVDPQGKAMTYAQVKQLGLLATSVLALAKNPPADKDISPNNIPQPDVVEKEPAVVTEVLPIMSPDTRKHIQALVKEAKAQKIIAENTDIIMDPAKVKSLEAKFADFATQVGAKSIDEFLMWSYEMFYDLGKTKPDGLAVMAWTFRNMLAYHRTKEVKQELKDPDKKPTMFPKKAAAA